MPHPTSRYLLHEARANLGELVNRVFYNGEEIIIEKNNRPVAKLTSVKKEETLSLEEQRKRAMRWAGSWSKEDAAIVRKYAHQLRRSAKLIRP